jgi:hypothetical protein
LFKLGDLHRVERLQPEEILVAFNEFLDPGRLDQQAPFGLQQR